MQNQELFLSSPFRSSMGRNVWSLTVAFELFLLSVCRHFLCHSCVSPAGVVRQVKPLIGPLSTVLKLLMRNLTAQGEASQNVINVHVFVSAFWF